MRHDAPASRGFASERGTRQRRAAAESESAQAGTPREDDAVRRRTGVEALEADLIRVLTRPAVTGRFWVDLGAAEDFLATAGRSARLSYTHLFVKAAAIGAMASPAAHRQHGWFRVIDPAHADVGVSVAGEGMLAPVVVIEAADTKSLKTIAEELRHKARVAREDERKNTRRINRWIRLFPFPVLRRLITRLLLTSPALRRKTMGTIQVSNVGQMGVDEAYVPMAGELLLTCGTVRKFVVAGSDDVPVTRTGAVLVVHGSHRKLNGASGARFIDAVRDALANPGRLDRGTRREPHDSPERRY